MDNRNTQTQPIKPAESDELQTTEPPVRLPDHIIKVIKDIIDAYLNNRLDPRWISYARATKDTFNSFTNALGFGTVLERIPPERKIFCNQLKEDIHATDVHSLCTTAVKLGDAAKEAYGKPNVSYSIFFLIGHTIRNIIVRVLKDSYTKQYTDYITDFMKDLSAVEKMILETQYKQRDATNFLSQKERFETQLVYLEHNESIWSTLNHSNTFDKPELLPTKASDDPNKPFFLQKDFADKFFNSALKSQTPFANATLAEYIEKKYIEVKQIKGSKKTN